jgi:phosphoglucomutase
MLVVLQKPFVHVEDIVSAHWRSYGRNYYSRYDYEGVASPAANAVMDHLRSSFSSLPGTKFGSFTVATADEFTYLDPIDFSVSYNQGIRVLFTDGSRIVFRLSGTAGSGATVRMYLEKYQSQDQDDAALFLLTSKALEELVGIALKVSDIVKLSGFSSPTVIT